MLVQLQDGETGTGVCLLWLAGRVGGKVCNDFLYLKRFPLRVASDLEYIHYNPSPSSLFQRAETEFQLQCEFQSACD